MQFLQSLLHNPIVLLLFVALVVVGGKTHIYDAHNNLLAERIDTGY